MFNYSDFQKFDLLKHFIAILLLFIFTFNLGGDFLVFKFQQYQLRNEIVNNIKKGISDNELTAITITPSNEHELAWENEEEFHYKKMMYDVVHIEKLSANTTTYYCLTDAQELQLIADFMNDQHKKNKNKKRRNGPVKAFKFLSKTSLLPQKKDSPLLKKRRKDTFFYTETLSQRWLEVSSPPPKQIL